MRSTTKPSTTIPRAGPKDASANYQELLRQGLHSCQESGGDYWTDYNQHDPGVTILQQLCYAVTDLSYRTDFPIIDLLAPPPDAPATDQPPLYTGDKILTCDPVTPADYRRLFFDRIPGVKNAWVAPIQDHPMGVRGLYEIQVEAREQIEGKAELASIQKQVEQCMRSTRSLGEDIERVTILQTQPIRVEAALEIGADKNPTTVLAKVLFDIQRWLVPYPLVQPIDDLFRSVQPDQIWNGPLLGLGCMDQDSLKRLKPTVEAQDIVNIIMRVKGVKRIKNLRASSPPDGPSDSIKIKEGHVPRLYPPILELQDAYPINIELEGGVKWHVDTKAVWARIQELEANMRNRMSYATRSSQAMSYVQLPRGEYKDIKSYFSIQHQFPVVYGLSKYGISDNLIADAETLIRSRYGSMAAYEPDPGRTLKLKLEHQAQVRQLKAFLLFFEQLLANYLAQLSHVPDLFSLDEELGRTYFYQPLAHQPPESSEPRNIADVLLHQPASVPSSPSNYRVHVVDPSGKVGFFSAPVTQLPQAEQLRRQVIESGRHSHSYRIRKTGDDEYQLILHAGADFLAGQERFPSAEAAKSSAARWVTLMTGAVKLKHQQENLVKIHRREDFGVQIIDETARIVLSSTGLPSREEREQRISEIMAAGRAPGNYRLGAVPRGGFRLHLHNNSGELIAEGEEVFENEIAAEDGVDNLAALIARLAQNPVLHDRHLRRMPEVKETSKTPVQTYTESLEALERQNDNNYLTRRNNFLNHLLARFGEQFDDDILMQLDVRPFGEKDDFYLELIRWKIEFLRRYIERPCQEEDGPSEGTTVPSQAASFCKLGLGSGRGRGFDYSTADECNAVSGLERRLSLLLGLNGHMDGNQYREMKETLDEDQSFYYLQKQVSSLEPEHIKEDGEQYEVRHYRIVSSWRTGEPDLYDLHHNFVFSSDDSSILRQLLSFGTNRENYRVHRADGEYKVVFRSPSSDHGVEVHRAIGHDEAERAITSLIHYLHRIKQSVTQSYAGESVRVVEHVLLRPRREIERRPVRISHESGIHLSSPPLHPEHHTAHLELILHHGRQAENYRIEADSFGDTIVVLYQHQKPIAATHALANRLEAARAIALLAELIVSMAGDEPVRKKHSHKQAHDAFYSHRLSVFFPNWPLRFQSNEFKLYAEQMVRENAPAHLAINCFWLSVHDMREFEKMHNEWKALNVAVYSGKNAPDPAQRPALDEASDKLKAFIQKLQNEQARWTASTAGEP